MIHRGLFWSILATAGFLYGAIPETDVRHEPKKLMGRDYYTALYPHYDHAAGANWAGRSQVVRTDNPALNNEDFIREAVPVYHAQRVPPSAASGKAVWRTLAENFLPGEPDLEILTSNPKADRPLIVGFGGKRHILTYGGEIDLDQAEWKAWRAAHPNLLCCWSHIEWDNTVPLAYERGPKITDATRRAQVMDFLKQPAKTRYERLAIQRRFYDRMLDLYYSDKDIPGVMFASLYTGHIAAGFGAKTIIVETTNTSGGNSEYRWNISAMFARGAARQFDLPWEWYVAVYMNGYAADGTWINNAECVYPCKAGEVIKRHNGYNPGPDFGVSRSLQNRAFYFAYLNGANLVEQEEWSAIFTMWGEKEGKTILSPRGEDFKRYHAFTKRHPERGAPYTPVAILIPYAQGYPTYGGYPWANGAYGYTAGDHAVDAVFFTIVPGFARAEAMKKGIETNLHNAPYAQMYDVITPDAPQKPEELLAALKGYKAVIVAGDYPDRAFEKTLTRYREAGGRVLRVGEAEVPTPGANAVAKVQRGEVSFPKVAEMLRGLEKEYFPFEVSGDCLYGANRTEKGWWLWIFNNRGVTKFADVPQKIDASAAVKVRVNGKNKAFSRVTELLSDKKVAAKDASFEYVIPAGELAIFAIEKD